MIPHESPLGAEEIRERFARFSSHHFPDDDNMFSTIGQRNNGNDGEVNMEPEIRRLEDRIDAVNREGQLRLDAAMARIDGKFDTMMASIQHMEQSISQTSQRITGIKSTIIMTAIASVLTIVGIVFAGQALWASGFSSGQSDRPAVASAQNTPTH